MEFLRVRDLGMGERPDEEILDHAEREGLLVGSHDVNTMPAAAYARLSRGQSFPGLFMVQQTSPIGPVIENLVLIWAASDLEEWKDQVVFLPSLKLLAGKVLFHSPDRDEVYRKARELRPGRFAVRYLGTWPDNMALIDLSPLGRRRIELRPISP